MADTIASASDSSVIDIGTQCFNEANSNLANYPGVTQQMVDDLKTYRDQFSPEVTLHVTKQAEAKAQTQVKEAARTPFEAQIRLIRNVAKAAGASEAAMAALGIPVGDSKAPSNATVPAGQVDTSERLRHTISWTDAGTPDNRKKPRGTLGAEIWLKLDGPPPTDEKECTFLTLDAATPYLAVYEGADAGKMAHYMLRWRMRDGTTLAWGETVSATITG